MIDWRDWQVDSNMTIYDCITFSSFDPLTMNAAEQKPLALPGFPLRVSVSLCLCLRPCLKGLRLEEQIMNINNIRYEYTARAWKVQVPTLGQQTLSLPSHYHTFEWNAHWNFIEHARSSCSLHLFTLFKVGSPNPTALKVTRLQLRFHWNRVDQHGPCLCAANARRSLLGPWPPGNAWVMLCWKTAYLHTTKHVTSPWCDRDVTVTSSNQIYPNHAKAYRNRASAVKLSTWQRKCECISRHTKRMALIV